MIMVASIVKILNIPKIASLIKVQILLRADIRVIQGSLNSLRAFEQESLDYLEHIQK
jgi:hypothetical protein